MTKIPPTREPRAFVAGSTVIWTRSLADYPATDGWTLKYFLRGPGEPLDITCTTDGDDFKATISATASKLEPGDYWLEGRVENAGGEKYIVFRDQIRILPGLDAANTYDGKSENEKILEAITATLKKVATSAQQEYSIAGRQLRFMSRSELIKHHSYFSAIVRDERRQRAAAQGQPYLKNVHVRF